MVGWAILWVMSTREAKDHVGSGWSVAVAGRACQATAGAEHGAGGVLGEWSLGLVLGRSCALTMVGLVWATVKGERPGTVRQRRREWCYAADRKRGSKRQAVEVAACCSELLAWIVGSWSGRQVALAMDATSLGDRFVVLAISVV